MMVLSIISLLMTIIAFPLGWLTLSSSRFQIYSLYDHIEESLRRLASSLNALEALALTDKSEETVRIASVWASNNLTGYILAFGDKKIQDLSKVLLRFKKFGTIADGDKQILQDGKKKADRLLGSCRYEKQKLDGCLVGNWRTLWLLCQKRPITISSIMQTLCQHANDPSKTISWEGSVRQSNLT